MNRIYEINKLLEAGINQADPRRRGQPSLPSGAKSTNAGKRMAFFRTGSGFIDDPFTERLSATVLSNEPEDPDSHTKIQSVYDWNFKTKQWDYAGEFEIIEDFNEDSESMAVWPDDIKKELPEAWAAWEALGLNLDYPG